MNNATLRCAAEPIDRRAALGSLAAVGALLAVPRAAKAETLDAELFTLTAKAKALRGAFDDASAACSAAYARMVSPSAPSALIFTDQDHEMFPNILAPVGGPLFPGYVNRIRDMRETLTDIVIGLGKGSRALKRDPRKMIQRAVEIEDAHDLHEQAQAAARHAAGVTKAEEELKRLEDELARLWRAIALTPARSVEGVVAKLDAVAAVIRDPYDSDAWPEEAEAEDVLQMAAVDLAALSKS